MAKAPRCGPYICGIDAALDVVSGKWKGLILWELDAHRVRRFAELRRGLPGVSEKMLTQHLREMEEDGLVHREVFAEVPPRVEKLLTEHGRTLNQALGPLGAWGSERMRREGSEVVDLPRSHTARHPGHQPRACAPLLRAEVLRTTELHRRA
ncbi:helix-turn-helix transcriptional regulator [Streptomyces sp. NBC_00053]|uniref:winged helix-turn-helix transcriptional regulator n=1 Tax=unclassified Streptomyces TaxID=2593676 RepID=UPI000FC0FE09|nr:MULTISPECIES: helix-turn-helix domain-containing protein [unclassified Streptomyces]WSG55550.1 helix-turn-helix transcriptional regulator [Streptomyces sp. NBC_01732]WSX06689.1 helix-turn-helix transcriptional regulator [Streptomyces sp. NBC_00987]MCX5497967.1 helix-turn-helix transcriptional regulator [Streptomyces sp. NBC_00052]MCX5553502.1 helix-turn-helix transcriptional regulator [Streptomyces sp. NBC_00051]RPK59055.1 putative HTH-type transcriptional regulator YtcD [Streptomyces sp. A